MPKGAVEISVEGSFPETKRMLKKMRLGKQFEVLKQCGELGVQALSSATPVDTGKVASSWSYTIETKPASYTVTWTNSVVQNGVNIALILQLGHGTRNGGYVKGRDYINPAIQPIFDNMANAVWKEVVA